jgi:hypothetical protein
MNRLPLWFWPTVAGLCAWQLVLFRVGLPCVTSSNETCAAFVDVMYGPLRLFWPLWYLAWDLLGSTGGALFILGLTAPVGTLVGFSVLEVQIAYSKRVAAAEARGA